jgi:4-amino-4-deoxy-L-arabinose transferase-like glycosyltransferase
MTEGRPADGNTDHSIWWAIGIALVALLLRLSLVNFTMRHMDEAIIATLTQQSVNQGTLTANWAGFSTEWWSRPTYQFSPYTLVQSVIARLVHACVNWPSDIPGYTLLACVCSCCWGAMAVLLVFFLGRTCFSPGAGLWGEAILATCFLHVQDSIYARVDAFLCCLVLVSLILAIRAARRPGHYGWLAAASLVVGVTLAAKYNSIPVLALVPWITLCWVQAGKISRARAAILTLVGLVIAGAGLIIATPELLWQATTFFTGLRYEISHYANGQPPYQAFDWKDNNLFYWTRYLVWLGFGWLPSLCAIWFVIRSVVLRRTEDLFLATFLAIAAVLTLITKVRFERNLEICVGPLALASGVMAWELFRWLKMRPKVVVARLLCVSMLAIWFFQPVQVLYHFRQTLGYPQQFTARKQAPPFLPIRTFEVRSVNDIGSMSKTTGISQVILWDFGDPFSAAALPKWNAFLGGEPVLELRSPWFEHGYPFSTVDVYHGPRRAFLYQKPQGIAWGAPRKP